MKILIVVGLYIIIVAIWVLRQMKKAPHGYEDAEGFHALKKRTDDKKTGTHETTTNC